MVSKSKIISYDVGIIGGGVAGAFAALRVAENFKNKKAILFDIGRPPSKRRRQLEGWLGCFPFGDGKLHTNDVDKVMAYADGRKVSPINKWVNDKFKEAGPMKIISDKLPNAAVQKKAESLNFNIIKNDYVQWKPDSVHKLSRIISEKVEESGNVEFSFDNQVHTIEKKGKTFIVTTDLGVFHCKKVLICVGRSGWRWANNLYKSFGIVKSNNIAKYGITVECSSQHMKEFNKSHCSLIRDDLEIGPFNWHGTIIPEDHADLVVSGFRSNEDRWRSDKVSFQLIGNIEIENGSYETERMGKLSFLLFNDRVGKEKVRSILRKRSTISQLPEYDWLRDKIKEIEAIFPNIITKSSFHAPSIVPTLAKINIKNNLETDVSGLFVTGESADLFGIMSAAISGAVAIDGALK
jgi:uncharacterized FAD-dependent dehydrogenase